LMPDDTSITSILYPVSGNYSIVWEYNASDTTDHWKKYDPGAPFGNDLTSMVPGKGYWLMMTYDDTLDISGTVPETTDIELMNGWNLIGYNSLNAQPITDALSSINGNYSIVWAYNASDTADHWKKYDPSAPFGNDLETMEQGKGYWIMMNTNDILT
jgi:carbohydrate-selective porin OprB